MNHSGRLLAVEKNENFTFHSFNSFNSLYKSKWCFRKKTVTVLSENLVFCHSKSKSFNLLSAHKLLGPCGLILTLMLMLGNPMTNDKLFLRNWIRITIANGMKVTLESRWNEMSLVSSACSLFSMLYAKCMLLVIG